MKTFSFLFSIIISLTLLQNCTNVKDKNSNGTLVLIETTMGNIKVKLYDETPKHRDNFVKLVNEGYYNGVLFHRVIKDFMVQTGDPDSRNASPGQQLGSGGPGYTIPAEFHKDLYHKKGALAAARMGDQVNPEKASSGSQFYIVVGTLYNDGDLDQMENRVNDMNQQSIFYKFYKQEMEKAQSAGQEADPASVQEKAIELTRDSLTRYPVFHFPPNHREVYKTLGGTPFLDNNYTVFGEVVEGMDVIEKIDHVQTDSNDRPVEDVKIIKMEVVKK